MEWCYGLYDVLMWWNQTPAIIINAMVFFHLAFRVNVDQDKDEQEYEDEIAAEVLDLELELEEEHQRKLTEHKKQLEEWKAWRIKQVSVCLTDCLHGGTISPAKTFVGKPLDRLTFQTLTPSWGHQPGDDRISLINHDVSTQTDQKFHNSFVKISI